MTRALLKSFYALSVLLTIIAVSFFLVMMVLVLIELADNGRLPSDVGFVIFFAVASPCVALTISIFLGVLSKHWPEKKATATAEPPPIEESKMIQELYRQGLELERRMEALETVLLDRIT